MKTPTNNCHNFERPVPTLIDALSRILGRVTEGVDPLKPANQLKPTLPQPVADALGQAMSNNNADRFETVEEFWHVLQDSVTQKFPGVTAIDQTQSTPPHQAIEDRNTQSLPKVQRASHAHVRALLRVIAILLSIGALAVAFFLVSQRLYRPSSLLSGCSPSLTRCTAA